MSPAALTSCLNLQMSVCRAQRGSADDTLGGQVAGLASATLNPCCFQSQAVGSLGRTGALAARPWLELLCLCVGVLVSYTIHQMLEPMLPASRCGVNTHVVFAFLWAPKGPHASTGALCRIFPKVRWAVISERGSPLITLHFSWFYSASSPPGTFVPPLMRMLVQEALQD